MTREPSAINSDTRLVLERLIDAPVALVWEVWTKAEHLARWWGPQGFGATAPALDLRIGGTITVMLTAPDGSSHPARGTFSEIVPEQKLVIDGSPNAADACGAGLPPHAHVTVLFEARGDKTRLVIDTEFSTVDARLAALDGGYREGWTDSMDRIAAYLDAKA